MKKSFQALLVGGVVFVIVVILAGEMCFLKENQKRQQLLLEVGEKTSDVKWLIRLGEVSEEEVMQLQAATVDGEEIERVSELLDSILKDKEEKWLEEMQEMLYGN